MLKPARINSGKNLPTEYPIDYDLLPNEVRDGIKKYIEEGIRPDDFIRAIMCNNLFGTIFTAPHNLSIEDLKTIMSFFYHEVPGKAYGNPANVSKWISSGGLKTKVEAIKKGG